MNPCEGCCHNRMHAAVSKCLFFFGFIIGLILGAII